MTEPPSTTDATDADLIAAVRTGDLEAYGDLFARHRDAATRLARQLVPGPDADDLVAEGFAKVMAALQRGQGPDEFFRAYLLTSIRRLHIDRIRSGKRVRPTGEESELDQAVEFVDPAELKFEQQAAATAFAALPERWQLVLWHLDVEGQKPAQIAPLLGMTPNSVSALAYRAREGLRAAYLQTHLAPTVDEGCRTTTGLLSQYVRKTLRKRDMATVDEHLDGCARCTALQLELAEINGNLAAWLALPLLGTATAGYLASSGAIAATGLLGGAGLAARLQSVTSSGPVAASAVVGAATVAVVSTVVGLNLVAGDDQAPEVISSQPNNAPSRPQPAPARTSATTQSTPEPETPDHERPTPEPEPTPAPLPTSTASPDRPGPTKPRATRSPSPRPSPVITAPEPTPTPTPTATPPDPPSNVDYSVAVGFVNEMPTYQRRVTVTVGTADTDPSGQLITVSLTFAVSEDQAYYRGGVSSAWACDQPAVEAAFATMTCTRPQSGSTVPPLQFALLGLNPQIDATVTAADNDDPDPANNSVHAAAAAWTTP